MTTKEVSEKFKIEAKEISNLCKEGLIPACKIKGKWDISDDLKFIMKKRSITYVLWQILNLKNNPGYAVSLKGIQTINLLQNCLDYFLSQGLISEYNSVTTNLRDMLSSTIITESGMNLLYGWREAIKYGSLTFSLINISGDISLCKIL